MSTMCATLPAEGVLEDAPDRQRCEPPASEVQCIEHAPEEVER